MSEKMSEEQVGFLDELLGSPTPDVDPPADDVDGIKGADEQDLNPDKSVEEPPQIQDEQPSATDNQDQDAQDPMALLRDQIVKLTEQLNADPLRQTVQEDVPNNVENQRQPDAKPAKLESFLTADELDRVIDEPDVLNKAFERAISVIQQNMQGVIQAEVNRQVMVSRAVTDFYTANQDLAPYNKFVQFVMSEVEQANSDKTYAEIFEITAKETRRRLGLGQSSEASQRQKSQPNQQRPAFAGSKRSTQRPAGKQEFFDPNAADMMNLL